MPHTDAAAVALARDGDSEAFRALVERHSRAVYRLAHRMTGSPSDAEDVVQETFLRAFKQLGRFESRANFGTWLHRIAVNCSIDLIRSRPRRESAQDAMDLEQLVPGDAIAADAGRTSPERLMLSTEVKERINGAMGSLSQMERAAFMLRHFEGHSIDEISQSLGLKTNATKHSIFRAVRKMRVALEPFVGDLIESRATSHDMNHVTEQDLVLHYYGELQGADEREVATHLSGCSNCRHDFTRLQRVLGAIDESVIAPELPDGFERTVWARLEPNLGARRRGWFSWMAFNPMPLALAAAVLVLVGAAFFAGRLSTPKVPAATTAANPSEQVRERILLVDLGEHLNRTQMVLVELVSADPQATLDVTGERADAEQLVAANRLYRQTAVSTGDTAMGDLLDEVERVLVEVAAGPGQLTPEQLDSVRKQIEGQGLLFRVRIVSSKVRERQNQAIQRRAGQRS